MIRVVNSFLVFIVLASCGNDQSGQKDKVSGKDSDSTNKSVVQDPVSAVPMYRDSLKKDVVAEYRVKTDNPLNDWYFSVRLFETRKTFHYLIRLEYEEITGTDTLRLPNFGTMPEPVIRKGPEQYSCIIGFLDKDKQFREYKKVYVKNDVLKITALKHYAVATYQGSKEE